MTRRRLAAAICAVAIAMGYGACNRIVDLTPHSLGPDAGFTGDAPFDIFDTLPSDASGAGGDDGLDAIPLDTLDAS
jgi:hypothetical protein